MMNVHDVGGLSLGEFAAICRHWARAHGDAQVAPPSEDEFERAVTNSRA